MSYFHICCLLDVREGTRDVQIRERRIWLSQKMDLVHDKIRAKDWMHYTTTRQLYIHKNPTNPKYVSFNPGVRAPGEEGWQLLDPPAQEQRGPPGAPGRPGGLRRTDRPAGGVSRVGEPLPEGQGGRGRGGDQEPGGGRCQDKGADQCARGEQRDQWYWRRFKMMWTTRKELVCFVSNWKKWFLSQNCIW